MGSDYSYYAFICWFEKGEYRVTDDVLYLRAYVDDGVYYWPPLVKAGSSVTVEQAVLALPDDACFAFCTDKFVADTYGGYYVYTHRDWAEYIYKAGDFISLSPASKVRIRSVSTRFAKATSTTSPVSRATGLPRASSTTRRRRAQSGSTKSCEAG